MVIGVGLPIGMRGRERLDAEQRALEIGITIAGGADVILLDEPTASLDPSAKREVESLIDEVARDGTTLVMATHNLGQAKRLATRVLYLDAGRVAVDLPTQDFFDPAASHAASLFLKGELPWT